MRRYSLPRFLLVGVVNTIVGAAIMFALYNGARFSYWLSSACIYCLTSVLGFFLNKHFTFGVRRWSAGMIAAFTLTIAISYAAAYGAARPLMSRILEDSPQSIRENAALFTGMCLFTTLNYLGQRFFVFRNEEDDMKSVEKTLTFSGARKIITVCAIVGIAVSVSLLLPAAQDAFIAFVEHALLHRAFGSDWHGRIMMGGIYGALIFLTLLFALHSKLAAARLSEETTKRIYAGVEIALPALFTLWVILLAASNQGIWVDEAYSLAAIRHSWSDMMALLKQDVHPPLYYILLKGVSLFFGDGVFAMKMVSIVPTVLTLIITTLFLRREFSGRAAVLFQLCFLASQPMFHYGIEIRMYSWGLFFVTMTAIAAWRVVSTGRARWWLVFLVFAEGAAYTHYYAALVVAIGYAMLFCRALRDSRRQIILALCVAAGAVVLYLPWLFTAIGMFSRVSGDFWVTPITVRAIIGYVEFVFSCGNIFLTLFFCLLYFAVFCFFLSRKNKTNKEWFAFAALCCFFALAAAGIIVSLTVRPLFVDRYLFPSFGLVWLFFAVVCASIPSRRALVFVYTALFIFGFATGTGSLATERQEHRDFMAFYDFFSGKIKADDIVVFPSGSTSGHLPGITAYLFPGHLQIYESGSSVEAAEVYDRIKLPRSALSRDEITADRAAWVITAEKEKDGTTASPFFVMRDDTLTLCGTFGWDFYKFNLYYTETPAALPRIFVAEEMAPVP